MGIKTGDRDYTQKVGYLECLPKIVELEGKRYIFMKTFFFFLNKSRTSGRLTLWLSIRRFGEKPLRYSFYSKSYLNHYAILTTLLLALNYVLGASRCLNRSEL